jgi:hypothetical protein
MKKGKKKERDRKEKRKGRRIKRYMKREKELSSKRDRQISETSGPGMPLSNTCW